MGSCYSGDHIARNNTGLTACNILEAQQQYRLGRSIIDYVRGVKVVLWDPTLAFCFCSGLHEGILTHK